MAKSAKQIAEEYNAFMSEQLGDRFSVDAQAGRRGNSLNYDNVGFIGLHDTSDKGEPVSHLPYVPPSYHTMVNKDGSVRQARNLDRTSAGMAKANNQSLNLAFVGNVAGVGPKGKSGIAPNMTAQHALATGLLGMQRAAPNNVTRGHGQFTAPKTSWTNPVNGKSLPGSFFSLGGYRGRNPAEASWRDAVQGMVDPLGMAVDESQVGRSIENNAPFSSNVSDYAPYSPNDVNSAPLDRETVDSLDGVKSNGPGLFTSTLTPPAPNATTRGLMAGQSLKDQRSFDLGPVFGDQFAGKSSDPFVGVGKGPDLGGLSIPGGAFSSPASSPPSATTSYGGSLDNAGMNNPPSTSGISSPGTMGETEMSGYSPPSSSAPFSGPATPSYSGPTSFSISQDDTMRPTPSQATNISDVGMVSEAEAQAAMGANSHNASQPTSISVGAPEALGAIAAMGHGPTQNQLSNSFGGLSAPAAAPSRNAGSFALSGLGPAAAAASMASMTGPGMNGPSARGPSMAMTGPGMNGPAAETPAYSNQAPFSSPSLTSNAMAMGPGVNGPSPTQTSLNSMPSLPSMSPNLATVANSFGPPAPTQSPFGATPAPSYSSLNGFSSTSQDVNSEQGVGMDSRGMGMGVDPESLSGLNGFGPGFDGFGGGMGMSDGVGGSHDGGMGDDTGPAAGMGMGFGNSDSPFSDAPGFGGSMAGDGLGGIGTDSSVGEGVGSVGDDTSGPGGGDGDGGASGGGVGGDGSGSDDTGGGDSTGGLGDAFGGGFDISDLGDGMW